ncbi:MAG TPA: type II toxin-antitoxin system PemK/MazF family toxin [Candidatus Sulfotelmatobacter sp.]|nr:type II toxin-antitoxin system PemK/MazF family toxin [Candidatus Sulfotelmatobacter sp.]
MSFPKRDEVWLVSLDPSRGSEIKKMRPCLIVSPDELNEWLRTAIIAPMTSTARQYPSRVEIRFRGKTGQVALDQVRAVDRGRLVRKLGNLPTSVAESVSRVLVEMFTR